VIAVDPVDCGLLLHRVAKINFVSALPLVLALLLLLLLLRPKAEERARGLSKVAF